MRDVLERAFMLKPNLRLERMDENRVVLIGEQEHYLLSGRSMVQVAPLLDGRRTGSELLVALKNQVTPAEVFHALASMWQAGYLTEATPELPPAQVALWHSLGVGPGGVARRLAECTVALRTLGPDAEPLRQALEAAGLRVGTSGQGQVELVLVQDYLASGLDEVHRDATGRGLPWIPVKLTGAVPWLGPVFRPGAGACWSCLAWRLRANRPVEELLSRCTGTPVLPPAADAPASLQAAAGFAALELARWLAEGFQSRLDTRLLALQLRRFHVEEHAVVRRPQCPACGDPGLLRERAGRPLVLEPRPKRFGADGGFRCFTPEETFARLEHQISPLTGVVCSLGPVPGRDHPLRPVYGAVALARPPRDEAPSAGDFHFMSAGKGRTPAQARASALCEAIERHSAIFQGDEPRLRARFSELAEEALHPASLLNFSEAQYARREEWNRRHADPKRSIPLPFDEHAELEWTPVWSLTHGRRRYAPTGWCYSRYPARPEERFFAADSNGNASGNCLEEAILQGFLELVERDAVAVWWYNRLRRPGVQLRGFGEPYFEELLEHYRSLGWRLWALDLTHDLGIPVFAALGCSDTEGRFCAGFGAHLDARLGLQRALTEFNQLFDPQRSLPPPWSVADVEGESFLSPDSSVPARSRDDFTVYQSEDLREDVLTCVARAGRAGLETLVLDQTRPDIGLCAVKVLVPGLRHFWPRFGPGRLYDVPVRMGWRDRPLDESGLNPVPLFL